MIKLLTLSDLHLRSSRPRCRLDKDFVTTQLRKLSFILREANERNIDALLLAGDVFDTAFVGYDLLVTIIQLFHNYSFKRKIIAVYGQHDLRYHSLKQISNTPLSVLLVALKGERAGSDPIFLGNNVCIKGASFGEKIPLPEKGCFNILLLHRMVVENEAETYLHDCIESKTLLEKTEYDLIISGDNHQSFYVRKNNKLLVNNGSILRMRSDQYEHVPRVSYIEINEEGINRFEWIKVPCKPSHLVLKSVEEEKKEQTDKINKFISRLVKQSKNKHGDFTSTLALIIRDMKEERIKIWLEKLLEQIAKEKDTT